MSKTIGSPTASGDAEQRVGSDPSRFPCFDGLRAIAAVGILVHHTAFASQAALSSLGPYFAELTVGVFIFFVISGFLLYYPFARAHLSTRPPPEARGFWVRRASRIYPGYWVALIFGLYLLPAHLFDFPNLRIASLNFLLLQRYTTSASVFAGLPQSWTLVVEVSFYIFVPIYAWILSRAVRRPSLRTELAGIAFLVVVGIGVQYWSTWWTVWQPLNVLPYCISIFALGMLLAVGRAWADERGETPNWMEAVGRYPVIWWTLALLCAVGTVEVLGVTVGGHLSYGTIFATLQLHSLLALFVVVPAVFGVQDHGVIRRFLRLRPMLFLGLTSYGIYLWQVTVISIVRNEILDLTQKQMNTWELLVPVFVFTVIIATISYFVVEKPCIELARRALRARRPI